MAPWSCRNRTPFLSRSDPRGASFSSGGADARRSTEGVRRKQGTLLAAVIRKAFVMSVVPGREAEYAARHNPIWPELEEVLTAHGVHSYSIFLLPETRQLFAYVEIASEARWEAVAATAVCRKWWTSLRAIMPSHPDGRPVAEDLIEVFHLPAEP